MTGHPQAAGHLKVSKNVQWPFLDLLRFSAALLVLFGHTRGLVFASFQDVHQAGFATKLFYFLTGIHREGVAIFFAVSGFLVGGAVWRTILENRFDAKSYLINRFARIYLVLVPALALTFLLDWAGRSFLGETRFYGVRPLMPMGLTSDSDWGQLACNLAAIQGIFCKPLGANPPLWSLGYEWVFYLIAPFLFGLVLPKRLVLVRIFGLVLLLAGMLYLAGNVERWLPWLAIWLAGAWAAQAVRRRELPLAASLAGLVLIGAGFVVSRLQILPPFGTDLMVGIGTALAIANRRLLSWCPFERPVRIGADFSYSLYLIHVPITVCLGGLIERFGGPSSLALPGIPAYAAFTGMVIGALIAAFLFAQATERHTAQFRDMLLGRRRTAASAFSTPA